MPTTPLKLTAEAAHDELAAKLAALPAELELTREFPPEVVAEAEAVVADPARFPTPTAPTSSS